MDCLSCLEGVATVGRPETSADAVPGPGPSRWGNRASRSEESAIAKWGFSSILIIFRAPSRTGGMAVTVLMQRVWRRLSENGERAGVSGEQLNKVGEERDAAGRWCSPACRDQTQIRGRECGFCGIPLVHAATGRPARWRSPHCRTAAHPGTPKSTKTLWRARPQRKRSPSPRRGLRRGRLQSGTMPDNSRRPRRSPVNATIDA